MTLYERLKSEMDAGHKVAWVSSDNTLHVVDMLSRNLIPDEPGPVAILESLEYAALDHCSLDEFVRIERLASMPLPESSPTPDRRKGAKP